MMRHSFLFLSLASAMTLTFVGCSSDDADDSNGSSGAAGAAGMDAATGGSAGAGATGGDAGTSVETGGSSPEGGSAGQAGEGGQGGEAGSQSTRKTISGSATWNVIFDAQAKAAGAKDCSYTRQYEGVQDHSKPWVCTSCEVIFRANVTVSDGKKDCYDQISDADPAEEEWVGYANGTWYRTSYAVVAASDQGTTSLTGNTISIVNEAKDMEADIIGAGSFGFDIEGTFTMGEESGDILHGWVASNTYGCAWEKANPSPYTGNFTLKVGQTLPDGLMRDKCDDIYRLHDAKGRYLVVFLSAMNCPACNSMASQETAFIEEMEGKGIELTTITIMQPSLQNPFGETTKTQLEYWTTKHGIKTPVLSDRGLGLFMLLPHYPENLGYPAWIVADPNLKVLQHGVGMDWSTIRNTIVKDAG